VGRAEEFYSSGTKRGSFKAANSAQKLLSAGETMRILAILFLAAAAALAQAPAVQAPTMKPVGTVDDLMKSFIWPASDEVFYITTRDTPMNEEEWLHFQGRMLMLAESANLLMMPGRAWDNDQWMKDALRLRDAGTAAYVAAKAKDLDKIAALNEEMYAACVACHNDYRPNYRKRPLTPQ
jgi:hypothetical protein